MHIKPKLEPLKLNVRLQEWECGNCGGWHYTVGMVKSTQCPYLACHSEKIINTREVYAAIPKN
jgi:predicted Zn-ribbon and HTH transcriptional regulator